MNKELLKTCRAVTGLTQMQLAEAIGVKQAIISKYEAGIVPISATTKRKVIQALADKGLSQESIYLLSGLKKQD